MKKEKIKIEVEPAFLILTAMAIQSFLHQEDKFHKMLPDATLNDISKVAQLLLEKGLEATKKI